MTLSTDAQTRQPDNHRMAVNAQAEHAIDSRETRDTARRFARVAHYYDWMKRFLETSLRGGREILWSIVDGPRILEVGVGTGVNMPYYPRGEQITAIDLSPEMLERAQKRSRQLGLSIDLRQDDAQALSFPSRYFDCVVATCVFCSIPNPLLGMAEVLRVSKPGGRVLELEYVLASQRRLAALMNVIDPAFVRLMGSHINRRTVENVRNSGLHVDRVRDLDSLGILKLIEARRTK